MGRRFSTRRTLFGSRVLFFGIALFGSLSPRANAQEAQQAEDRTSPGKPEPGDAPDASEVSDAGSPASLCEAMVQRGLEARRQGDDARALVLFDAAERLVSSPRVEAQLGLAHQALGHWLQAEQALTRALSATADSWIARHRGALEAALQVIDSHLGWLQVRCNVRAATVSIAGTSTSPVNTRLRVPSGPIEVRVSAPGYRTVALSVLVPAQTTATEVLTLPPLEAPRAQPSSRASKPAEPRRKATGGSSSDLRRPVGWVMVGVGTAAVGYGIFSGIRTLQLKADRDAHCTIAGCSESGILLDDQARRSAAESTLSTTLGAVLLGSGALLLLLSKPNSSSSLIQVTASPASLGLGGSLSIQRRF